MVYNMADQDTTPETGKEGSGANNVGRRRFLGAGTAVAPFVLTLVSQPALGDTCFSPSRNLSRNTSLSQQGKYGECLRAESPGNYGQQVLDAKKNGNTNPAYHWPVDVFPTHPFHATFKKGSVAGETSFTKDPNDASMTLGEVLLIKVQRTGNVAKHIIAAYLNIRGGNGAVIPPSVLTVLGVQNIWFEYVTNGFYAPMAGVKWDGQKIVDYLISNGIVKGN